MTLLNEPIIWWVTAVELPVLGGLFWIIWKTKQDAAQLRETLEVRCSQLREGLSAFKLEVAKGYASVSDMRELEGRLVGHLLRIESKLDTTALKAEALRANLSND